MKTTEALRAEWNRLIEGLQYDSHVPTAELRALASTLLSGEGVTDPTPEQWVNALARVRVPCRRCACTGMFVTMVVNGQPKGNGGPCFRCGGRGSQTARDGHRNYAYDKHQAALAMRAMMR